MVGMLVSSASYHRLPRTEKAARVLRRLDHAAIWGAVAGTWTPIALAVLPGPSGIALAGGMWGAAVTAAVAKTAAFDRVDPKVNVLYVLMGWVGVGILPRTVRQLGPRATGFLIAGGTAYTVGAIGYATKRPNLVPGVYGYHEMWHTATLAGAGLHAVAVKAALEAIRDVAGLTRRRRRRVSDPFSSIVTAWSWPRSTRWSERDSVATTSATPTSGGPWSRCSSRRAGR